MKYFALVMCAFYVAAGCALLLTSWLADIIHNYRSVIGAVLLIYGLVRGVMWWRKFGGASQET